MKAFILISLSEGFNQRIIKELHSYSQVADANFIFGEWDIIAEVNVANAEELYGFVIERLRSRPDVKLTSSLIVAGQ